MMRRVLYILVLMATVLTGCRKDLCYEHFHPHQGWIRVVVDYSRMDYTPSEMRVDFYRTEDNSHYIRFITPSYDLVDLPAGTYNVQVFNDNSEYIQLRNREGYTTHEAYMPALTRAQYNSLYEGRMVPFSRFSTNTPPAGEDGNSPYVMRQAPEATYKIGQPDLFFVASAEGFIVEDDPSQQTELHVTPVNTTKVYRVEVKINGIEGMVLTRGTLGGVSPALFLYNRCCVWEKNVAVMFDCSRGTDRITTDITAFGLIKGDPSNPDCHSENTLILEFLMADLTVFTYEVDVRDRLTEDLCLNGGTIYLDDITITLPDVTPVDGAFEAEVGDWDDEEIVILR